MTTELVPKPEAAKSGSAKTAPPSHDVVVHSLPCIKCWYDLRSLSKRDRCPECGTPVGRTVRSLFASDHRYLRRTRAKLSLAFYSLPLGFGVLVAVASASGVLGVFGWTLNLLPFLLIPLPMSMAAIGLAGFVQVEGRLSRRIEYPGDKLRPSWAVWLTVACMTLFIVTAVLSSLPELEQFAAIPISLGILTPIIWTARNVVLAPHLKRLSRRLGIRNRPMLSAIIGLAALAAATLLFLASFSQSVYAIVFFAATAGLAIWAILHLMNTLLVCRRCIDEVLRYRASMGKIRPRFAR